jgi:hypothetical protein
MQSDSINRMPSGVLLAVKLGPCLPFSAFHLDPLVEKFSRSSNLVDTLSLVDEPSE